MKTFISKILVICLFLISYNTNAQFGKGKKEKGEKNNGENRIYSEKDGDNFTPDKGTKSEFHKTNENKIILFKSPVKYEDASDAKSSNSFNLGEAIYGRVFLQTRLENYAGVTSPISEHPGLNEKYPYEQFYIKVFIDNKEIGSHITENCYSDKDIVFRDQSFSFNIILVGAAGDEAVKYNDNGSLFDELSKSNSGSHIVRLEMFKGQSRMNSVQHESPKPIAIGEFTFEKKEGTVSKSGFTFNEIGDKITDAQLETECMNTFIQYCKKYKWEGTVSGVRTMSEWSIWRNNNGAATYRDRNVVVLLKQPDGKCVYSKSLIRQANNNGGWDKEVTIGDFGLFNNKIDCK